MKKILIVLLILPLAGCGREEGEASLHCEQGVFLEGPSQLVVLEREGGEVSLGLSRPVDLFWSEYDPEEIDPLTQPMELREEMPFTGGAVMDVEKSVVFYVSDPAQDFYLFEDVEWVACW